MLKLTGNLEQEIMNILWDKTAGLRPNEVQHLLKDGLAYTTVNTILQRLCQKKILTRKKEGNTFIYSPKLSKEQYAKQTLQGLYQGILESYGSLAISHFLESVDANPEHRRLLQEYLDEHK